jgi:hypothetical protein
MGKQQMVNDSMIRIHYFKNITIEPIVYYCYELNQFYVQIKLVQPCRSVKWRTIRRRYVNRDNTEMYKEYKYVIFSLPTQREIVRINEDDWLEHRDDAIERSKEWEEELKRFDEAFDKREQEWIQECHKIDEELERSEKELAKKQEKSQKNYQKQGQKNCQKNRQKNKSKIISFS